MMVYLGQSQFITSVRWEGIAFLDLMVSGYLVSISVPIEEWRAFLQDQLRNTEPCLIPDVFLKAFGEEHGDR